MFDKPTLFCSNLVILIDKINSMKYYSCIYCIQKMEEK